MIELIKYFPVFSDANLDKKKLSQILLKNCILLEEGDGGGRLGWLSVEFAPFVPFEPFVPVVVSC